MAETNREQLLHTLYEAAELEHNLMCTYLYAAWSLKSGAEEGLSPERDAMLAEWKQEILRVAIEEMSHLVSVWNITVALGGAPRIGRFNFPLEQGALPASIVVKLAPFTRETLQHFIFLERPADSAETDGAGFDSSRGRARGNASARHTPMPEDYETVGAFYESLKTQLADFVATHGEARAFCGDRGLQIAGGGLGLPQARPVVCAKTALEAFDAIVTQGEGAAQVCSDSHYARFLRVREALDAVLKSEPDFHAAHPAAVNPVLRAPVRPEGRVWIEDPRAAATVDLANAAYGLMLRVLAYAYAVPATDARKNTLLQLAIGLMRAVSPLAEAAARLPAGPSNPGCHAGMSFTTLRDSAALPPGAAADRLLRERFREFADGAVQIAAWSERHERASRVFVKLAQLCEAQLPELPTTAASATATAAATPASAPPAAAPSRVEIVPGKRIEIHYEGVRCIHSRHCVTGAPTVFLANVQGPWIHPDTMEVERLVDIAHLCPSGAIRYHRLDGAPDESAPPVNLASIREAGPLALRAELVINGEPAGFRATLCRCGASKHKPYCDGTHKEIGFGASGEPASQGTDMLPVRDGPLRVDPEHNGPLAVTGNLEITSGTGRVVSRITSARLCRCGGSQNKPFCDGTHARIGFSSE
ncbi:MAG: ferritin-like domain-containing protein [Pseudomonadota bacterium]